MASTLDRSPSIWNFFASLGALALLFEKNQRKYRKNNRKLSIDCAWAVANTVCYKFERISPAYIRPTFKFKPIFTRCFHFRQNNRNRTLRTRKENCSNLSIKVTSRWWQRNCASSCHASHLKFLMFYSIFQLYHCNELWKWFENEDNFVWLHRVSKQQKIGLERPCWRTYDNMWIDFIDIFEQSKDRQMFTVTKGSNDSSETRRTSKWDTLFQHFHFCFNSICWFLPHGCINSIELGATVAFKIKLQMNKPFIFIVYWSITLAYSCLQKIGKVQWALTSNSMANRVYNRQPNCMFYNHR